MHANIFRHSTIIITIFVASETPMCILIKKKHFFPFFTLLKIFLSSDEELQLIHKSLEDVYEVRIVSDWIFPHRQLFVLSFHSYCLLSWCQGNNNKKGAFRSSWLIYKVEHASHYTDSWSFFVAVNGIIYCDTFNRL